jgi:hypothetical protein
MVAAADDAETVVELSAGTLFDDRNPSITNTVEEALQRLPGEERNERSDVVSQEKHKGKVPFVC